MWWDPSITMDRHIISLIPFFEPVQVIKYNINADKIEEICTSSVEHLHVQSLIGALTLISQKSKVQHFAKDFPINYLKHLNRLFFLVSNHKMSRQKQSYLRWYLRIIFINWLRVAEKSKIQKLMSQLQGFIQLIEKCWGSKDEKQQISKWLSKILIQFQKLFFDRNINKNPAQYEQIFHDHAVSIIKNKRLITFVYIIYELIFLYLKQTFKLEYNNLPIQIFDYLKGVLFKVSEINRLSFTIQTLSFVLRKFLLVLLKFPQQMRNDIRQTIIAFRTKQETIFSEQQRYSFNAFHMKPNKYFDYLQIVLDQKNLYSSQKINYWKKSIRDSMEKSVKQLQRAVTQSDIDQVVFYLQIRKKQEYLYGDTQQINAFPDIRSKVVKNVIVAKNLKHLETSDQFCAIFMLQLFHSVDKRQSFNNLNLFEKSLLLYYLAYYQAIKHLEDASELKNITKKERQSQIDFAFNHLFDNQDLLRLLDFYLFQIRLGDYHNVQKPKTKKKVNKVYNLLYERLVQTIYTRIINALVEFKQIRTTIELKNVLYLTNYFAILVQALTKQNQTIYVCQYCKIKVSHLECPFCESILIGIKLVVNRNEYNHRLEIEDYRSMVEQLRQIVDELIIKIGQFITGNRGEWPSMFLLVLQRMQQLVEYFDY